VMEVVLNDVSFFDHDHETRSGSSGSGSGNGSGSGSGAAYSARFRLRGPHKRGEMRQYVDKASLHLQPGSVTALIGSPEETSHLLEIIGLRQHSGFIGGSIYHDNSIRKNGSCFRDIAYVKDFDSNFFGHLTVEAFLMWASQLRLALSEAECSARAREAAKILNLEGHVQIKDLRRGQRILLSVAAELVENPTLICIDSPIDFMEESHVSAVVRAFNKISHRQNTSTTIVFTAIAPSANSLKYIDQLALFFNTKLLYSSGEMFDYKNPKLGNISKGHGNSKFGNGYHKKMGIAGEKDENALKFRQIVAECQDVLCTLFRDISRSGYGTTYFASQFVSSDHRVSSYKKDAESQTIFSIKRVEAIEERIFKHLTVIASKTEGYENLHDDESKMCV
jgi:ABC-type multidrug transport system ATPase subunit